jgi:hypothetical protein
MPHPILAVTAFCLCLQACGGCSAVRLTGDATSDVPPVLRAWARTFGDPGEDRATVVLQAPGGGFFVAGWTSFRVLGVDFWLLGLDENGNILWERACGGEKDEWALDAALRTDGGLLAAGWTKSTTIGILDTWVVELDAGGGVQWQKAYGGPGRDIVFAVHRTPDGGTVLGGEALDAEGLFYRPWILKLDGGGSIAWQKTYGRFESESGLDVNLTADGGFIAARWSHVDATGDEDVILFRLDGAGELLWSRSYGAAGVDVSARSVSPASDGGFVVAGGAGLSTGRGIDLWVIRLDGDGGILWQKAYGGGEDDSATSIRETPDGGFVVSGLTRSFGAGSSDVWLLRLDSSGNPVWQRTYGGEAEEGDSRVMTTSDGGFIVASSTTSFGAGDWDAWVLKLNPDGTISDDCPAGIGDATSAPVFETSMVGETIALDRAAHDATAAVTNAVAAPVEPTADTQCSL